MPVPKRKHSRARRDKRSANKGVTFKALSGCQTCKEPIASHQVCPACGHYKGVKVLRTKDDRLQERSRAEEAREIKARAHQAVAQGEESNQEKE